MARGDFPSAKQDQFVLRFPEGLRERIKTIADRNGRSMNAEIVGRLESSLDSNVDPKALSEAFAIAEDMRERARAEWDFTIEFRENSRLDRLRQNEEIRLKQQRIAERFRERRERERAAQDQLRADLAEEKEKNRASHKEQMDALKQKQKDLDEVIQRLESREKQLADVIRSLSSSNEKQL